MRAGGNRGGGRGPLRHLPGLRLALTLSAATLACLPIPHREWDWPEITGTLLQDGKPLARIAIGLAVRRSEVCDAPASQTDAAGHFHLANDAHIEWLFWGGDKFDAWTLCFTLPDGEAKWTEHGMWGGPRAEQLTCSVGATDGGTAVRCDVCRQ